MNKNDKNNYLNFVRPYYVMNDAGRDFRHIQQIFSRLDVRAADAAPVARLHMLYFLGAFGGLAIYVKNNATFRSQVAAFLTGLGWFGIEIAEAFAGLQRYLRDPQNIEEQIIADLIAAAEKGEFNVHAVA